jgi:BirA family biotin operon repressor/biotin-[acetyl-CoA-carboxylase] ligase
MLLSSTQKKILTLLANGQFHSGTELAEIVGISRSAICKQVKNLTQLGLGVNAISGKGYRLECALQLLSKTSIDENLSSFSRSLISELEIHDCINSTNNYLLDKAHLSNAHGLVCFAESQTAGKGRRGREWVSPYGSNIYLSILWNYQNGPAAISGLSLAVGVAVVRALHECGIENIGLKWPNDIFWQEKKLAGILIEVSGETNGPCSAVIGLGLNIYLPENKAKTIDQDWVDLHHIFTDNTPIIRNELAAALLNQLMPTIANFENDTLDKYLVEWRDNDCMKGKEVELYMGQQVFSGVVEGINNSGLLMLTNAQGEIKTFASGEVSFRQS